MRSNLVVTKNYRDTQEWRHVICLLALTHNALYKWTIIDKRNESDQFPLCKGGAA